MPNRATVSANQSIGGLFVELEQTGSLEAALAAGVRLACEESGCLAGALVADITAAGPERYWFRHDPHGLLGEAALDRASPADPAQSEQNRDRGPVCTAALPYVVQVPPCCADQDAGRLILLAPPEASEETLKTRIAGISAALAVLMAAAENRVANPLSGILSRVALRTRIASELSRSQRCNDELCVLHMRVTYGHGDTRSEMTEPWRAVASLGETLAGRLRKSDVVGLLGPDHLAVLLTGTGRLGARIAARRIEQLLRKPEDDRHGRLTAPPEFCLRVFPDDTSDADELCRAPHWRFETVVPADPAVRSK